MTAELSQQGVEQLLKGISIPPRPTLLVEINDELKRPEPDLRRVATLISKDVGVSAAMLKALNSPLFGLRSKIGNVSQAVQMLGARNVRNVVTGLVLRATVGNAPNLERFWDSAEKVASINAYLCSVLPKVPRDEAYMFGLFRDCGIPMLMMRFSNDYRETLKIAGGDERPLTEVEDERHGTTHATVGYVIARSWGLSDVVCQSIQLHHDLGLVYEDDSTQPLTRTLVAVNFLAEHLNDTSLRMRHDSQWEKYGAMTLEYLGLEPDEYDELREDVVALCS